jgi:hypothetical protein
VLDGMSYGVPGATSYFPMTQAICLRVRHGDYGFSYQNVDSRTVRTVNHNIAANSDRFIMGPYLRQLEAIVEERKVGPRPRKTSFRLCEALPVLHQGTDTQQSPPNVFWHQRWMRWSRPRKNDAASRNSM